MSLIEQLSAHVEQKAIDPSPRAVKIPEDERSDEAPTHEKIAAQAKGEQQAFVIEYQNSKGEKSTRRVTVARVDVRHDNTVHIHAFCHESKAHKQFRADRISEIIDFDGVCHSDATAFLLDNFDFNEPVADKKKKRKEVDPEESYSSWEIVLSSFRSDAQILVGISLADGDAHKLETDIVVAHCKKLINNTNLRVSSSSLAKIPGYIKRLRPNPDSIREAAAVVLARPKSTNIDLLNSAVAVMDAHNGRDARELELLDMVCFELTGRHLGAFRTPTQVTPHNH